MQIFYAPDMLGGVYQLSKDESKHAIRVLRLRNGDEIILADGKGCLFRSKIIDDNHNACIAEEIERTYKPKTRDFRIHIAIAPTKNIDRFEWMVEKCTEMGVDEITPIITQRSERSTIKMDRLNRITIAAIKQSINAYTPKINEIVDFKTMIVGAKEDVKLIAHCNDTKKDSIYRACGKQKDSIVFIGPEGDFTMEEVGWAIENGFTPISLGENRLRTETAGILACHGIIIANETQ